MTEPVRAVIYVRCAHDPDNIRQAVTRQEFACRALCANLGWEVVNVYADNDASGWTGSYRPAWEQLNTDIAAGLADAVACQDLKRLGRSPDVLADTARLFAAHRVQVATCMGEVLSPEQFGQAVERILRPVR